MSSILHALVGQKDSSEKKINDLLAKLGSIQMQVDEYSRRRTNEISETVKIRIDEIVHSTQIEQKELLDEAEKQFRLVEKDYQNKLTNFLNALDDEKATKLVQLEKDLNFCQEKVVESARRRIDAIDEEANRLKMEILREAQAENHSKVEEITDKVAQLGAEESIRRVKNVTTKCQKKFCTDL